MKVVLQVVTEASVRVDNQVVGEIGRGLLLLVGFGKDDTEDQLPAIISTIMKMRVFAKDGKAFAVDVREAEAEILAISQFTLLAGTSSGRRPDFSAALEFTQAKALFDTFVEQLRASGVSKVATGSFGAYMQVQSINDGPITILLDDTLRRASGSSI